MTCIRSEDPMRKDTGWAFTRHQYRRLARDESSAHRDERRSSGARTPRAAMAALVLVACSDDGSPGPAPTPPAPVLLGSSTAPSSLAVDATSVYWTDDVDRSVSTAGLDGNVRERR